MTMAMKSIVVIPTFNEAENILGVVSRIKEALPEIEILIVDDGSPDGTADLVEGRAHLLRRKTKTGLGRAYLAGFAWALEQGYEVVCQMDADGSHQPEELPQLLSAISGADLVIGSRWVSGGEVRNWPLKREAISRAGNLYVRALLGMKIKDATSGFRVYRSSLLSRLDLATVQSKGYAFQVDLTYRAHRVGARITEQPITFVERELGDSKMQGAIIAEALIRTTRWGLRRLPLFPAEKSKTFL